MTTITNQDNDYLNPASDDEAYPLPPDAPSTAEAIKTVADPPSLGRPLAIPRVRRELKSFVEDAKVAMKELKQVQFGEAPVLGKLALDALVSGATDARLPLDGDAPRTRQLRELAGAGKFNAHAALAMDELEEALATTEAGLSALKVISLLDEPLPAEWGNLSPLLLARKLNVLGHTLLRGRIAGVNI